MSSVNRVIKNTGILYAKMAITVFISLYTTRLVLVALGVNDFGIFNVVGGAIAMLTFLNTAMAAATQRFMSYAEGAGDHAKQKSIFNVAFVLHIVIGVIVLIILEVVGYFLFRGVFKIPYDRVDSAKLVYQFMAISTFFTITSVPYDAVINAHENMLLYSILGILESILKLGIAVYILHTQSDKLVIYGFLIATLSIFLLIIRRIYCSKKYSECQIAIMTYFDKMIFYELTSFAAWSFLGSATSILSNYGQGIVMNMFFGPIVNTAQGIAGQVSGQLSVFAGTMQKALNPVIDKSEGAGNRTAMLSASMMGSKVSFFLLMLFFIPVLIEMPYIFQLWLKNVPEYAVTFCRLLLFRNLIEQLFVTLVSSISATGNIRQYQIYSSALGFFPLIVCFLLFKLGFPPTVLYQTFIVYSLLASCMILYFTKKTADLSIPFFLKNVILRCLTCFVLVGVSAYIPFLIFNYSGFGRLSSVIVISGIAFFTTVWYIGFNSQEKEGISLIFSGLLAKLKRRKS